MPDFSIGFVIFPGITQLDFTGPFEVLSRLGTPPSISAPSRFAHAKTLVVAKTMLPVSSDRGLGIVPTCTFETCPPLNMICVPGGAGVADAISDAETLDFIRRQGAQADYVTSVGMGAFLLGAAGLLNGRRVATHWATSTCCRGSAPVTVTSGWCATVTSSPEVASPPEQTLH